MRSAHSMTLAWTPHAERRRPKMVLERISPSLWSGFWRETNHEDCLSPSTVPLSSPEGAPDPEFNPESPEAHKCPHPPTRSCLLLRCRLSAPLPTINMVRAPRDCHPPTEPVGWSDEVQPEERSPQAMAGQRPTKAEPAGRGSPVELVHRHPSIHQLHRTPSSRQLHLGPPDLRLSLQSPRLHPGPPGSSASPWLVGSPSPPWAPPPPAPPPLVGPLESAAIPPPWLLPPSALPWAVIMAVAWVLLCSSCSGPLLSPPWLLLPSSPLLSLPVVLLLSLLLNSHLFPPLLFYGARTHLPGGGRYVRTCFAPVSVQCSIIWSCSGPRLV